MQSKAFGLSNIGFAGFRIFVPSATRNTFANLFPELTILTQLNTGLLADIARLGTIRHSTRLFIATLLPFFKPLASLFFAIFLDEFPSGGVFTQFGCGSLGWTFAPSSGT